MARGLTAKEITEIVDSGILDDEIIKALECCNSTAIGQCLNKCPYYNYSAVCIKAMLKDTLDLINRQKAENERLTKECGNQSALWSKHYENIFETAKETAKSEAIKEFWKKAKEKGTTAYYDYQQRPCVWVEDGDNLVEEMVGEE